jgi:hypothetical protein
MGEPNRLAGVVPALDALEPVSHRVSVDGGPVWAQWDESEFGAIAIPRIDSRVLCVVERLGGRLRTGVVDELITTSVHADDVYEM